MAVFAKSWITTGLQHVQTCLLSQSIRHRWNAKHALTSIGFGNHHPSYRTGPVRACMQALAELSPAWAQHMKRLPDAEHIHTLMQLRAASPVVINLWRYLHSKPTGIPLCFF